MKQFQFQSIVNPDATLTIPPELAAQIEQGKPVHVMLVVPDSEEDHQWADLTAQQFLKGYAEGDAIYDGMSGEW